MATCGNCGQGLRDGARFCGTCGQPVATAPTGKPAVDPAASGKTRVVLPTPAGPPPRGANTTTVLAGVIIAAMVLIGLVTVVLLSSGDDEGASTVPAQEASTASDTDSEVDEDAPSPGPSSTTSSTTTTPDDGLPPGEWAALLYAATSYGPADAERAALSGFGDVQVLNSSDYTTLKPGLYVVYVGGFLRASGALDYCRAIGRYDRSLCYARFLSRDTSVTWNIPGTDEPRPEFLAYP